MKKSYLIEQHGIILKRKKEYRQEMEEEDGWWEKYINTTYK